MLGAKDAFARPARAVLTVASLALAAVLVVCTMGFEATMDRVGTDSALRAQPWDLRVDTEGVAAAHARPGARAQRRHHRRRPAVRHRAGERRRAASRSSAACSSPCAAAWPRSRSPCARGAPALRPGETTLGRGALEALHARIGDTVRLSAHGMPFSARVVGRHVEPDDDGRVAVLPLAGVPRAAIQRHRRPGLGRAAAAGRRPRTRSSGRS